MIMNWLSILRKRRIILEPKNWREKLIFKWSSIKCEFNGPVSIRVEEWDFDKPQTFPGGVVLHSNRKITPLFKWYRFSFLVTRRYMEDYGEGAINGGFPYRFKRGWRDYDIDCWTWYIMPFHIIIPFFKLTRIWFLWEIVRKIDDKQVKIDLTVELKRKIRTEAYHDGFEDARRWLSNQNKVKLVYDLPDHNAEVDGSNSG